MADVNGTVMARVLESGENTSEGKQTAVASWWAKLLMITGIVTSIVPQIIDSIRQVPGVETSKTGSTVLAILGGVLAIGGIILKASATSSFNNGRSLIKAAAAREISPSTTIPPAL